ncbi:unnamed protein product [Staurois parvus]|uniref:Uncharacterized protein n=1 Tax=Staurois parvus TaxID=386267 RepID=A0ABN9D3A2_9NEOB|nr:unnamed protein product [Staurois parvus]
MGGHTATYDKMETSRSVRRPESGTWQSVEQWEAVQGPRSHCGLSSSVTRRGTGAHGRFGAWWHLWKACNLPATL